MGWEEPGGSATSAGVEALSLDLVAHALAGVRDPRDRKVCHLVSRAFARAEAASRRVCRVLRRKSLQGVLHVFLALRELDLSAYAGLDDASLAATLSFAAVLSSAGAELEVWRVRLAQGEQGRVARAGGTSGSVPEPQGRGPLPLCRRRRHGRPRPHGRENREMTQG
ncbi:hypothetical protein ACP4OV_021112 [Aristida adscensionis]